MSSMHDLIREYVRIVYYNESWFSVYNQTGRGSAIVDVNHPHGYSSAGHGTVKQQIFHRIRHARQAEESIPPTALLTFISIRHVWLKKPGFNTDRSHPTRPCKESTFFHDLNTALIQQPLLQQHIHGVVRNERKRKGGGVYTPAALVGSLSASR